MKKPIIEVNQLSKKYKIGKKQDYYTLRDVIGNPLKSLKEKKEEFWALKNVSFTVNKGEVLGVIGPNGAGKSTLLKILSRITPPTEGEVIMRGRVASLLEVGTGFHQELTGRENIYLNGSILGMSKKEIDRKFDQIVKFAEMGKFLDTPIKHYSSGMKVKLAFSVAAHLEPEILLIDEVLAVGDADFQKKSLGKMNEITKDQGRTILFVSHNLTAVKELCTKTILLSNGSIGKYGKTNQVVNYYHEGGANRGKKRKTIDSYRQKKSENPTLCIEDIYVKGHKNTVPILTTDNGVTISIAVAVYSEIKKGNISLSLINSAGIKTELAFSLDDNFDLSLKKGHHKIEFTQKEMLLSPDRYYISVGINQSVNTNAWDEVSHYPIFEIKNRSDVVHWGSRPWGVYHTKNNEWKISK